MAQLTPNYLYNLMLHYQEHQTINLHSIDFIYYSISVVFIFGGYDGSVISEGTWRLNLETLEWRKLQNDLPEPVYFNATAMSPVRNLPSGNFNEKNNNKNPIKPIYR